MKLYHLKKQALATVLSTFVLAAAAQAELEVSLSTGFEAGMPEGYTTHDLDGREHHFTMVQLGLANGVSWMCMKESGKSNRYAASTSKHKIQSGVENIAASNWLVTPQLRILASDAVLTWRAQSVCESIDEGDTYEVYVSTKGNRPEDFKGQPVFRIEGESVNSWTAHEVKLGQFANQYVYIAFVNKSLQREILAIDDIKVQSSKGIMDLSSSWDKFIYGTQTAKLGGALKNNGEGELSAFSVCADVEGETLKIDCSDALVKPGETFEFEFDKEFATIPGDTINYKIWVEWGEWLPDTLKAYTRPMLFDPYRRIVIEKGTGMWCGYCPTGIIAMERMKKKYPEEFIGIAVHYDDDFHVNGYSDEIKFSSFPSMYVNRQHMVAPMVLTYETGKYDFTMGSGGVETAFLEEQGEETIADISVVVHHEAEKIIAEATTRFAISKSDLDYRIAFVAVEDRVTGPYQTNYYSGNTDYTLDGFAELPQYIAPFVFDDVARSIAGEVYGIPASVPTAVEAGASYTFEHKFEASGISNYSNVRVVAMLIDMATGEIVNAAQTQLSTTGIDAVTMEQGKTAVYYDLSGRRVAQPAAKGIYIRNGKKVMQ